MEQNPQNNEVGQFKPPTIHRFSSLNQPTGKAKSKGHKSKFRSALLVRAVLERKPVKGGVMEGLVRQAAEFFSIPEKEIDYEILMIHAQVVRAIESKDVQAFNAVMDRAYGKPLLRINEEWTPPETAGLKLTNGREITL